MTASDSASEATSSVAGGDESVLVVDDDEGVRETLAEVVKAGGCSVLLAANGEQALHILRARRPCLMILDLFMPVMTGTELLDKLQADPGIAVFPVVILTSAPSQAPEGFPVLEKPMDIDAIWDIMRRSCRCSP